jgi:transcriptional regulator with XRE-family HTH domain
VGAVHSIERATASPRISTLEQLANGLGVQLSDLLDREAPMAELHIPNRGPDQPILEALDDLRHTLDGEDRAVTHQLLKEQLSQRVGRRSAR